MMETALDVHRALTDDELRRLDAYWRAANYLTVGQIYLLDNPLLRDPLTPDDIKPRLLGHWGTSPGLSSTQRSTPRWHQLPTSCRCPTASPPPWASAGTSSTARRCSAWWTPPRARASGRGPPRRGCSVTAVAGGRSVHTSRSFSPTGGLP
jgi:hypothetical protein